MTLLCAWFCESPTEVIAQDAPQVKALQSAQEVPVANPKSATVQPPARLMRTPHVICLVGNLGSVPASDAFTATALVCDELKRQGIGVKGPFTDPGDASEAYRVHIRPLGRVVLFEISHEKPVGTTIKTRRLQLASIENITWATPRLVQDITSKKGSPIAAKLSTLTLKETKIPRLIPTRLQFSIGVGGIGTIGGEAEAGYGVEFAAMHVGARIGGGLALRIMGGDAHLIALSVAGRYYFNEANISPFVQGALGVYELEVEKEDTTYKNRGLGTSMEIGLEFMRFSRSRLGAAFRVDIPFFKLRDSNSSLYTIPIGLSAYYLFN